MKLLARVDVGVPSRRAADFVYLDMTPDYAAWLLDQYQLFQQMLKIPGPLALWVTFVDDHAQWYTATNGLPGFECFAHNLLVTGWVILPDHFEPAGQAYKAGIIPSVKAHMNIGREGISWNILMRGNCHHGTQPLAEMLLKQIAGIKLPPVLQPTSASESSHDHPDHQ